MGFKKQRLKLPSGYMKKKDQEIVKQVHEVLKTLNKENGHVYTDYNYRFCRAPPKPRPYTVNKVVQEAGLDYAEATGEKEFIEVLDKCTFSDGNAMQGIERLKKYIRPTPVIDNNCPSVHLGKKWMRHEFAFRVGDNVEGQARRPDEMYGQKSKRDKLTLPEFTLKNIMNTKIKRAHNSGPIHDAVGDKGENDKVCVEMLQEYVEFIKECYEEGIEPRLEMMPVVLYNAFVKEQAHDVCRCVEDDCTCANPFKARSIQCDQVWVHRLDKTFFDPINKREMTRANEIGIGVHVWGGGLHDRIGKYVIDEELNDTFKNMGATEEELQKVFCDADVGAWDTTVNEEEIAEHNAWMCEQYNWQGADDFTKFAWWHTQNFIAYYMCHTHLAMYRRKVLVIDGTVSSGTVRTSHIASWVHEWVTKSRIMWAICMAATIISEAEAEIGKDVWEGLERCPYYNSKVERSPSLVGWKWSDEYDILDPDTKAPVARKKLVEYARMTYKLLTGRGFFHIVYGDDYWHKSYMFAQPFMNLETVQWYLKSRFGFTVKPTGKGSNETTVMEDTVFLKRHMFYEDGEMYSRRDRADLAMRVYHNSCQQDLTHHLTHKIMLMMETLGTDDKLLAFISFVAMRLIQSNAEVKFERQWIRDFRHNVTEKRELVEILEKDVDQLKKYLLDRQKRGWKPNKRHKGRNPHARNDRRRMYHPYSGMAPLTYAADPSKMPVEGIGGSGRVVGREGRKLIMGKLKETQDFIRYAKVNRAKVMADVTDRFEDVFTAVIRDSGVK